MTSCIPSPTALPSCVSSCRKRKRKKYKFFIS